MNKKELQIEVMLTALELDHETIAQRAGVDRSAVTRTLRGSRRSEKLIDRIAGVVAEDFKALVKNESEVAATT